MSIDAAELMAISNRARRFLEPYWLEWHSAWGSPALSRPSQWTCVRSSLFLCAVLRQADHPAHLASGVPSRQPGLERDFGYLSQRGWTSHAWVQVDRFLVDLTHDQFGGQGVIVVPTNDLRFEPGCDADTTLPVTTAGRQAVDLALRSWSLAQPR